MLPDPTLVRNVRSTDIPELVGNMLEADLREIMDGAGINPVLSVLYSLSSSEHAVSFTDRNGKLAGMAGVTSDGAIWMHCTHTVKTIPLLFCKEARKFLDCLHHRILWNRCDIRNTGHLKLLRHLGFKFINVVPEGPSNIYFVEFVKLWTPSLELQ